MIGLLRQESESEGVAAMDLAAAAEARSELSIEMLDSLVWSGGRLARTDNVDAAASGFLRNFIRTALLWICLL